MSSTSLNYKVTARAVGASLSLRLGRNLASSEISSGEAVAFCGKTAERERCRQVPSSEAMQGCGQSWMGQQSPGMGLHGCQCWTGLLEQAACPGCGVVPVWRWGAQHAPCSGHKWRCLDLVSNFLHICEVFLWSPHGSAGLTSPLTCRWWMMEGHC